MDWIINISKYDILAGSSHIKLLKESAGSKNCRINNQSFDDNKCFIKWCLIKYLNPADHHPERIRKAERMFENKQDFNDIKFHFKIRDNKKNLELEFLVMKIRKNVNCICLESPSKDTLIY